MSTKKKARAATDNCRPNIESMELDNNNNVDKDIQYMDSVIDKFSDIEISFMIKQLNLHNAMGYEVKKKDLLQLPIGFMLKFISNSKVAEFGALLKNIIQVKLLNKIK